MTLTDTAFDPLAIGVIFIALALGGTIKGATGAGAPVVAIPVMAAFYDPRLAVAIMAMPNLITNTVQLYRTRKFQLDRAFGWKFGFAGIVGVFFGTAILATAPTELLSNLIALIILVYIALRLARPDFGLTDALARKLVWAVGGFAGVLQGALGISAPVSIGFLNAMRISREAFIATIATFFGMMAFAQIPIMMAFDLLTWPLLALGTLAVLPLMAFMPLGNWLAKKLSAAAFDRLILLLLSALAIRLLASGLS